ncbi:MAG: neutral zinc metallopeptidase [Bacteroidota bacterium]
MKWKGRRSSSNVEDRRGQSSGSYGGRGMRIPNLGRGGGRKGGMGCGTLILVAIFFLFIAPKLGLFDQGYQLPPSPGEYNTNYYDGESSHPHGTTYTQADGTEMDDFLGVVLADTEDVWKYIFEKQLGRRYQEPAMVLYSGSTSSACGHASSATGPFYCPGDYKLYIDLSFYDDLRKKFKAPGDFAMAYVVAHEVAHHVQKQLGATEYVNQFRGSDRQNEMSVRLELQADFYAGVWAHYMALQGEIIEDGDIREALTAASAIGDDRLQKQSRGYVIPDSFTHGTSAQRMRWFKKGFESGDIRQGNTFELDYNQL